MILVDSSVWIDYFRGASSRQTAELDSLLGSEELAVGDLVVAEVLQGFSDATQFDRVRDLLARFEQVTIGGYVIAVRAAKNYLALRARGVVVRKTIDTLIATRCIEDGYALLHSDRDFEPFVAHLGLRSVF